MDGYAIVNLRDLLNEIGENETKSILSTFSCHLNLELEKFIRFKAIEFSKRRFASTHLVLASHRGKPVIVGYFAIANKAIVVPTKMLSHRLRSRISLFAVERTMLPGENKPTEYIIPAPLIGQLGKNFDNGYNMNQMINDLCRIGLLTQKDNLNLIKFGDCRNFNSISHPSKNRISAIKVSEEKLKFYIDKIGSLLIKLLNYYPK